MAGICKAMADQTGIADPDSRALKTAGAYAAGSADRAEPMRLEVRPDDAECGFIECMRNHIPFLLTGEGGAEARFLQGKNAATGPAATA